MRLHELIDVKKLNEYIYEGYISRRVHPHFPLTCLNYTQKTKEENKWDTITQMCRGLVVDLQGKIIVYCMPKIFNYDKKPVDFDMSGEIQVTEKLPGSLAFISFYDDYMIVATREGFETEEVELVHHLITEEEEKAFQLLCSSGATAVIHLNKYGLVLLGIIADYKYQGAKQIWTPADQIYSWPGVYVKRIDLTLRQALNFNRDIIIYFENTGQRLKVLRENK